MVLGALSGLSEVRKAALWSALSCSVPIGADSIRPSVRDPSACDQAPWQARLARFTRRPELIVTEGFGWAGVAAALYRSVSGRVAFRVFLTEPPKRIGWLERLILRFADGVLVDGEATARAVSSVGFPARSVHRIVPRHDLEPFLRIKPVRLAAESRRIVVVSNLDPSSGVADLLVAVMAWAEAHPDESVELCWVGEGDLSSVLVAQPLPPNVAQRFFGPPGGPLGTAAVAAEFARSGLLVVPSFLDDGRAPVAAALAAGLPVVGSLQSREVRNLVTEGVNGWLFDPLEPGDMLGGLTRALAAAPQTLDAMRCRARASVAGAAPGPAGCIRHRTFAARVASRPSVKHTT